ncbi:hypothetical protein Tco_1277817, partial [Tanacetum coccineum]
AKAKRQARFTSCLKNFNVVQNGRIISNNTPQVSSVFAITSIEPKDSFIMGEKHPSTSHVEEIVPIPKESKDFLNNNKRCDLPICNDNMIFSNLLIEYKDDLNDDSILNKDAQIEDFRIHYNPLFEFDDNFNSSNVNPLFDEMEENVESENSNVSYSDECFDPGGHSDEINDFLAIKVSTNFEEGYYNSEGDVLYLESLLSDDTTHNLSPEVFFDHEPQNESDHGTLITFSPKSDPLHHEFTGELITLPSRIVREHEEYISRMLMLCDISSSWSPKKFHASPSMVIESLPTFPIPVEDSDSLREEIDIFLGPDDLIPPGVENDDSKNKDNSTALPKNESSTLDHFYDMSSSRPPPEPSDVEIRLNFETNTAVKNNFDVLNKDDCFKSGGGAIVVSQNVEDDD